MAPAITDHWFETRDGRRLFAQRSGSGTPTVVFEAGMGASRNSWGAVLPAITEVTTTVAYDRSGLGRSASDAAPRDLARLGDDLSDVLDQLDGPFVLVGHSWAGPIIRSVAARQPDRIAGLVLVDQTDENCDLFFSAANRRQSRIAPRIMPVLARLGITRYLAGRLARQLPEPWAAGMRSEDGTVAAIASQMAELAPCDDELVRLRDHPLTLPDVPVAVISGTKTGFLERGRRPELVEAHAATATGLPQGRHVLADNSSHYIPFTDPEIVVREILTMVSSSPA